MEINNYLTIKGNDGSDIKIDFFKVKKSSLIFRALNNKVRQNILALLDEKERLTVSQLSKVLMVDQAVASLHLGILRRAGIVKSRREGKCIYYDLNQNRVAEIGKCVDCLLATS